MSRYAFQKIALAGVILSGAQFLAQAQTTTITGTAVTSGIVAVPTGTTVQVQLNVLNLQTATVSASAVAQPSCSATLEFYDNTNKLLQSGAVMIAPASSKSLTLALPTPSSATGPQEIRAVVVTPTIIVTPVAVTTTPVSASCTLMPSLEVYDSTGIQVFTTDFRPMSVSGVQPASAVN